MKVYPFKIPKSSRESLTIEVDHGATFYDKLHQHQEIQIAYIVEGQGKLFVGDSFHSYTDGDVFVIGGNIPHLFQSMEGTKTSHMISLFFTETSFGDHFFDIPELEQLRYFFTKSDAGFKLLTHKSAVKKLMLKLPNDTKFSRFLRFFKLLKLLCNSETKTLATFVYPKNISSKEGNRMQVIFEYVINNFQKNINLDAVSELAYMTPNAFCRFFKNHTNKTFFQFLIELRIAHACQLIINHPDMSITEISDISGFTSISNFNRKFKELKGTTPSQYAKKMQADHIFSASD